MKNKILIFIVGLFAGLTIGVLFSVAIKTLISQFKELHLSLNKINLKQSQLSQRLDSIQGKLVPDVKKPAPVVQPNQKMSQANPVRNSTGNENAKPQNSKSTNTTGMAQDSDIVVMTNQLISVLSVPFKNKDTNSVNKKSEETDSVLESMSEVSDTKDPVNYRIEFWKSPLNYKGYKMSKGKIILYGISPVSNASLTKADGTYYLLVNQNAFRVEYTDDYKLFDRVTDKTILKKLGL